MILNVTDRKQYITTEGYPNGYLNNQDCSFNFVAPYGRKIIVFFEDVGLELGYDYIVFRKNRSVFNYCTYIYAISHQRLVKKDGLWLT